MDVHTESIPGTTARGIGEFRRRWLPEGEPWADLLVVHGIAEHSGRHDRFARALAAAGVAVSAFDLTGFGASGGRPAHVDSWTVFLDQVEDRLAAARHPDRPVALFGQSMGGLISLEYCLSERPSPDALVVCSPSLFGGALWQRMLAPVLAVLAPTASIPNALNGDQLSRDPEVGAAYFADPLVRSSTTPWLGNQLFDAMRRVTAHLSELDVPTLVIQGGSDTIVPPMSTAPLGRLRCVERRLYPSLRHEPLNEPEGPEITAEIVAWLQETLTSRRR